MKPYDLLVIGAGPGGYVAAITAAQQGKSVAVIEKGAIGGTCLNVGCIPSKTFLKHAEWVKTMQEANQQGIENTITKIDMNKLVARKRTVVKNLQSGITHLFKKYKIDLLTGEAQSTDHKNIYINNQKISAKNIILAMGSTPFIPPIKGLDKVQYYTTDTFFDIQTLPKKLVIVGGGVIGVEIAFAMALLGVRTTIVEIAEDILLTEDKDARSIIKESLKSHNITIVTNAKIDSIKNNKVVLIDKEIEFDKLLLASGRSANLNLAKDLKISLSQDQKFIATDSHYQTNVKNIYAIGDLIGGSMLAHTASAEAIAVVNEIFNPPANPVDLNQIPKCIYSFPEVASIGISESEAKQKGLDVTVKQLPFSMNGKGISANETEGFVKLISEPKYGEILGAVIVGANATELIHSILSTMQAEGTVDDLAQQVFAHPTLSEMIGEVAKSSIYKAVHE